MKTSAPRSRAVMLWIATASVFHLTAPGLFAQNTVQFNNAATTTLTTNTTSFPPPGQQPNQTGLTTSSGHYTVGLYIAPQGTTDPNAFTLMGPTTPNQTGLGNGRFNGNPSPNNFVISNNTGQTIAFQVRAWSTFAGATYEAALARTDRTDRYLGVSAIGQVTPAPNASAPALFGTGAGQVGGFVLTPGPEPLGGKVHFNNTSATTLSTNSGPAPAPPGQNPNATGLTGGPNHYRIGLYIAPQGTTNPNAFTLMGPTALSFSGGGTFSGNTTFSSPNSFLISNNIGQTIAFHVRAWSAFGGATYEEAYVSQQTNRSVYIGLSAIGEVTPSTNGATAPDLFGTGAGQVGGFVLFPGLFPAVSITNPTSFSLFAAPATIPVGVSATDSDGSVTNVQLLNNGIVAATKTAAPFTFTLSNLAAGYHTLSARAVDNQSFAATSAPVTIRVGSQPVLAFARVSNGMFRFQFNSVTGISYVVERGTLTNFSPVTTNSGTASPISFSQTNSGATQRTYRVRLQ